MELNLDWQSHACGRWPEVRYEIRPLRVWAFQELAAFWEQRSPRQAPADVAAGAAPEGGSAGGAPANLARTASGDTASGDTPSPASSSNAAPPSLSGALMDVARKVFPEHVRNLSGLELRREGASGPATLDDLCQEAALLPMAVEIIARLLEASQLTEADAKN